MHGNPQRSIYSVFSNAVTAENANACRNRIAPTHG
jgi:hypothetical protein